MAAIRSSLRRALGLACLCLVGGACVVIFNHVQVDPVDPSADTVLTAVKAHLLDGSTVVYPQGVVIVRDTVRTVAGVGTRYDLGLRPGTALPIPLDSVVGMETFRTAVDGAPTVIVSTLATGATAAAAALLAIAIFGSCPTYYADSAGTSVLEAEGFSYSIAPLFETRDVDRLRVRPGPDGMVRLEVRNEALETHYLNHLELLYVPHDADELVLPDSRGRPLAVRGWLPPARLTDRTGRDLRRTLAAQGGRFFRTDRRVLETVSLADMDDHIDIAVPAPPEADSVAVVLRARNSLLNTVLLYDFMLGARGARALDWVGSDLARIGPAVELGRWYATRMGMHVAVWSGGVYREVARIPDTGPIAWKDVAAMVPVPAGQRDTLRIRLSFVADNWRLDRVAVAAGVRRPKFTTLAPVAVAGEAEDTSALASVRAADGRYLSTVPGQRFAVSFDAGGTQAGSIHTFLLASQGYYIEWVRGAWLESGRDTTAFAPSDASLLVALERWRTEQDSFERRFDATRIPVR